METDVFENPICNSVYYPNNELFEPLLNEDLEIKKMVYEKMKKMVLKKNEYEKMLRWFKHLNELIERMEISVIIYGKIIYGKQNIEPSDIDLYIIAQNTNSQVRKRIWYLLHGENKPQDIHAHDIYIDSKCPIDGINGWRRFGLLNHLLVMPRPIPAWLSNTIDESRRIITNAKFFEGGVGELITYATFKILDKKEEEYFNTPQQAKMFFAKPMPAIVVYTDWGAPTPREINEFTRKVYKESMSETQLYQLSLAAMKRIGIKNEKRKDLAKKFVRELKPKKVLAIPG